MIDDALSHVTVYPCCCARLPIKKCVYVVALVSGLVIVSNFVAKIAGYSETTWDWELLFLVVDGVAVFSLLYGVRAERAAYLQPFVALSIITTSMLALLAGYLTQAIYDPNSYAGQDLELEVHKRLATVAHHLAIEFKYVVSLVAAVALIGVLCSIVLHCWFVYLTVQCAKYFREAELSVRLDRHQEQQHEPEQQQQCDRQQQTSFALVATVHDDYNIHNNNTDVNDKHDFVVLGGKI